MNNLQNNPEEKKYVSFSTLDRDISINTRAPFQYTDNSQFSQSQQKYQQLQRQVQYQVIQNEQTNNYDAVSRGLDTLYNNQINNNLNRNQFHDNFTCKKDSKNITNRDTTNKQNNYEGAIYRADGSFDK